jgi:hypothetical protein
MARTAGDSQSDPAVVPTVALAVVLAAGAFALLMPLVLIVNGPTPLPRPFPPQNQDAETQVYLLTFLVLLPASLFAAVRLAARTSLAAIALLAAALGAAIAAVKLAGALDRPDGVRTVLVAALAWWVLAAIVLAARVAVPARLAYGLAAAGVGAAVVALTDLDSVSGAGLLVAAVAAAAAVAAYDRLPVPRLGRRWLVALEVVAVVVLVLAVPDLLIFRPEDAPGNLAVSIETAIIRFHQNLLLGPANQMLHGAPMLVDTASQYGVGDIYAAVGWFLLAPIGYGTFGLLDGIWTAGWFVAGYAILRMAGVSRALTAAALALAVVALVFNLTYPVGALPQYGPLRFGMPMPLIVAAVAAERWPAHARLADGAALVVAGISALWSLEALAYTTFVFAALTAMRAWLREPPGRVRWAVGRLGMMAIAWVCAHALFALATLAGTGTLPHWDLYLEYLHVFLAGPVGDLTYDVPRWSPGLTVGAACVASAVTLIELARRRHPLLASQRVAAIALTGLTAYAIALLSYWVDRSLEHILVHIAFPVLLLCTLWLSLLLRSRATVSRALRRAGLAVALALAALVVAAAWSSIGDRFPRSALAYAAPGGESFRGALQRLWDPPPLNRAAVPGQAMLERHMPGEQRSLVFAAPDLAIEILVRSDRIDRLLLSDAWETSFVAKERLPDLRRRLADLRAGDRMLLDPAGVRALRGDDVGLAPLQRYALHAIQRRFRLRTVAADQGFVVMELRS